MTPSALAALHKAAFSATRAWSASEFARLLGQNGTILCHDTHSFALIRVTLDEAELLTLATDPKHRRLGLARAVLHRAEHAATSTGATQMFLEVAEDNIAATALYHNTGYVQVGRRPGYYVPKDGAAIAALVLRKQL